MFDYLIKNGKIIDGTKKNGFVADIAIIGDSIVEIGEINTPSNVEINAKGKIVCPGFIDLHTHSDASFLIDPYADSKLTQGVTLELVGNCGMSFCAPLIGGAKKRFEESFELEEDFPDRPTTPSAVFIDRCKHFKVKSPGKDWDRIWSMSTK